MRLSWSLVGVLLIAIVVGCTTVPTAAPTSPGGTAPPSSPVPTSSQSEGGSQTQPAAAPQAASKSSSAAWDQVVAAAKQEGHLVIVGGEGDETKTALTAGFQKEYPEIQIDFTGLNGSEIPPRLLGEVGSGQHLTDLVITGTTTIVGPLLQANALAPFTDYFVGPSSTQQSAWLNGSFTYADSAGQYNFVALEYVETPFIFNPSNLSDTDVTAWKDLLEPRFDGKIAMYDPRVAGGAQSEALFWYTTPSLGKDFIQSFFANNVTLSRDPRQMIDWVAQGQDLVALGLSELDIDSALQRGIPIERSTQQLQEGMFLVPGNGSLAVLADPPHPNATKLYLDWLLSKDGQSAWSQGVGFPSLRQDVPRGDVPDSLVPKPGVTYGQYGDEQYIGPRGDLVQFLSTVIPS